MPLALGFCLIGCLPSVDLVLEARYVLALLFVDLHGFIQRTERLCRLGSELIKLFVALNQGCACIAEVAFNIRHTIHDRPLKHTARAFVRSKIRIAIGQPLAQRGDLRVAELGLARAVFGY
ncbi:MAG: hypothetical protein AAFY64_06070, partial [Pseudomonadota bacterium]